MKLFKVVDGNLSISDEAYALTPFKILYDRDTSEGKDIANMELAFI